MNKCTGPLSQLLTTGSHMAGRNSTTEPPVLTLHICTGVCGLSLSLRCCVTTGIFPITWLMNPPLPHQVYVGWISGLLTRSIPLPSDLCCSYRISIPFVPVHVVLTRRSMKSIHVLKSSDTMCLQSETVRNRSTLSGVNLPRTFQESVFARLNVIIVITSAKEIMWQLAYVSVHLSEQINSWMNKFQ